MLRQAKGAVLIEDHSEKEVDDDATSIPALTLSHVSTLLAPLLRQTALARFSTVARAPDGRSRSSTSDDDLTATSSSSPSSSTSPTLPEWVHIHATEAPAVCAWWAAIARRLPNDKAFAIADEASCAGTGGVVTDIPSVRRQIDEWLLSATALSAQYAFNLRFGAAHECRRAAQLSATLCGIYSWVWLASMCGLDVWDVRCLDERSICLSMSTFCFA